MNRDIVYTPPKCKHEQHFTIYPHALGAEEVYLQSDNFTAKVNVKKKTMMLSKRIASYPRLVDCNEAHGGRSVDAPEKLFDDVKAVLESGRKLINSTGSYDLRKLM